MMTHSLWFQPSSRSSVLLIFMHEKLAFGLEDIHSDGDAMQEFAVVFGLFMRGQSNILRTERSRPEALQLDLTLCFKM